MVGKSNEFHDSKIISTKQKENRQRREPLQGQNRVDSNRLTSTTAQERLVGTINTSIVVEKLAGVAADNSARILRILEVAKQAEPDQAREEVVTTLSTFIATYTDIDGNPNMQALSGLADTLISKIDIISTEELLTTAKTVIAEAKSDPIVLYLPKEKVRSTELDSPVSHNSNEFMAKLVKKYAEIAGKHVVLLTDTQQYGYFDGVHLEKRITIADYKDFSAFGHITIVDDAMYTGHELGRIISKIAEKAQQPLCISLYTSRITDEGVRRILEKASQNPNILLDIHGGRKTQNLEEALADSPEARNFFLATKAENIRNNGSFIEVLAYAKQFIKETTLTISEVKTPDWLSFPSEITFGMVRRSLDKDYPHLDTLSFT